MGLTYSSTGTNTNNTFTSITKTSPSDKIIALAGNPNVGKSTVFNKLTGLKQHTGNWAGKTVTNAYGIKKHNNINNIIVDIPGTYSLLPHSTEEEVARDFICFSNPDKTIIVCDATCLERNMNLVLQTLEITPNVTICINMLDEAKRKNISIDTELLRVRTGVNVVAISAHKDKDISHLLDDTVSGNVYINKYPEEIENAVNKISSSIIKANPDYPLSSRWTAVTMLNNDTDTLNKICSYADFDITENSEINDAYKLAITTLKEEGLSQKDISDLIASSYIKNAEKICDGVISYNNKNYRNKDAKLDKFLTGKYTAVPCMLLLLGFVLWITIEGANYPSKLLSDALFSLEEIMLNFFSNTFVPEWLYTMLVSGVYRTVAWIVSVMLPPMAIFFPLFTLLEDLGYLPRIAFNLDSKFKKCNTCGKQALTMCMGLGCNAAGVIGCRIIDSPRERLIAIITNAFMPCNGRFPAMISIITMFFVISGGLFSSIVPALVLTAIILLGIIATFVTSKLLSKTLLRGMPSSFTLELPPYRKPQVLRVIYTSIIDRTLFVLGRAVAIAIPAGFVIWIMANISINGVSLLSHCTNFLDPMASVFGFDGVILMAFILAFPANEIVIPIIIMAYTASGIITDYSSLAELKQLFIANDWTIITAINFIIFSLMHWPCSTTCITIYKETKSIKWTLVSIILPTLCGLVLCFVINTLSCLLL